MSFRPRFRLSLLFVLAALVAGVSVWLRQAVVRDRNIRQLLAEPWVHGQIVNRDNQHAVHLNTKLLNFFSPNADYCDNLHRLIILPDNIDSFESFRQYEQTNLGDSLPVLLMMPSGDKSEETAAAETTVPLSYVRFWLERFPKVEMLGLMNLRLCDDSPAPLPARGQVEALLIEDCAAETTTLRKLLALLRPLPGNIIMTKNRIRGQTTDLQASGLSKMDYATFEKSNRFDEPATE